MECLSEQGQQEKKMITKGRFISSIGSVMLGAAALLWGAGSASAVTIFTDNFNRADNDTVGNGWIEHNDSANDVAIRDNQLRIRDQASTAPDAAIAQGTILITTGFTGLQVSFDYRRMQDDGDGVSNEAGDNLLVSWAPSGTSITGTGWTTAATLFSNSDSFVSTGLINLVGALGEIDVRLHTVVNNDDEGYMVDNFSVFGTPGASAVPLPPAVLLFGTALVGMGLLGRRRKKDGVAQA